MKRIILIFTVLAQMIFAGSAFSYTRGLTIGAYLPPTIGATLDESETQFEEVVTRGAAFNEVVQHVVLNNREVEIRTLILVE